MLYTWVHDKTKATDTQTCLQHDSYSMTHAVYSIIYDSCLNTILTRSIYAIIPIIPIIPIGTKIILKTILYNASAFVKTRMRPRRDI